MVLREPIIQVLFQHGQFMAESTQLTARALLYYALGLPAFAAIKLIVPAFYSTQDTKTPVRVAAYALVVNVVLNTLFLKTFFQTFYNGGPALATSLAAYLNFSVLFVTFRRRFGRLGTWELVSSLSRIAVCSTLMGLLCWGMLWLWRRAEFRALAPEVTVFALMIIGATVVYVLLAWLLRCHEVEEVYGIATRKDKEAAAPAMTE